MLENKSGLAKATIRNLSFRVPAKTLDRAHIEKRKVTDHDV